MSEAWITSATPSPPTDLMARSTSLRPNLWVVTFSSGKRFEASCASASSHALKLCPRALDGDELHGDFFQREIGELLHLALDHDGSTLALERFDAEQNRNRPGAGGAIERHVDALAARDLHDARERIFLLDVDGEVGAELPRDLHAHAVLGGAGDDDERGARLFADHRLREPLLARALDEHPGIVADATVEQGPFDPVRHRRHQSRELRRDALGDAVHDGVPGKVDVMGKAAPQVRSLLRRRVAVADG